MPAKTVKRESPYLRVGTTIYKRVRQPLSSGRSVETLIPWNVETLRQDYGKSYLACIPKYDGFCTVPDHTNYRREIDGFLNRYEPIPFQPADGIFPHIHDFFAHIFGEQVELGYDYLQLLYLRPLQRLPVLLLVSDERNTGKTTFLNLLKSIFGGNVTFNTNEDFRSQFNDDWMGKLLICVDEVLLNRREDSERIKNLSTARSYKAEAKGRDRREVEFFGKFVLCSNNERNPVLIEAAETRYWVRRVPPLPYDDQHLLAKMRAEIPGLLFYLQQRMLSSYEESRWSNTCWSKCRPRYRGCSSTCNNVCSRHMKRAACGSRPGCWPPMPCGGSYTTTAARPKPKCCRSSTTLWRPKTLRTIGST